MEDNWKDMELEEVRGSTGREGRQQNIFEDVYFPSITLGGDRWFVENGAPAGIPAE